MKLFRKITVLLIAMAVLCCTLSAYADGVDDMKIIDEDEFAAIVEEVCSNHGVSSDYVSVGLCYTKTGEECYFNGDTWLNSASLYKLPLIMSLANQVAQGELTQDSIVLSMKVSYVEKQCLIYSDNSCAMAMLKYYFSPFEALRELDAKWSGMPVDELPGDFYYTQNYSARFMVGVLKTLYNTPDDFPNVIDCMLQAQPNHYFRSQLEGEYDIAQKYGSTDLVNHAVGIIYTPTPILLAVMTDRTGVTLGDELIGDIARAMSEYSLRLDRSYSAAEAAAATPEPTPAPLPTPVPTPVPTTAPVETAAPTQAPAAEHESNIFLAAGCLGVSLLGVAILFIFKNHFSKRGWE